VRIFYWSLPRRLGRRPSGWFGDGALISGFRQERLEEKPGSDVETSEPGIFAELVSISSTRSAGVSDSAYFIGSIELRPTLDLFLGAFKG
jgi:hypothetical protein